MHSIRPAEPGDIPAILKLLIQVNNVHASGRPDLFIANRTKYTACELERIIGDPSTPAFVYLDDSDAVVGYAFCRFEEFSGESNMAMGKDLYLDDLCFDERARGRGFAQELLAHIKEYARSCGCRRITLHVWECNPQAARFYAKSGMRPYYTALEMTL